MVDGKCAKGSTATPRFVVILFCIVLTVFLSACSVVSSDTSVVSQDSAAAEEDSVPAVPTSGVAAEKIDSADVVKEDASSSATAADDVANSGQLVVRFIDVGQGDCALITCGGQSLMVDGGPSEASSKVYSILKRLGITGIDYVVATHPDTDHIGGLSGALTASTCGAFYCSSETSDTSTFESLVSRVKGQGLEVQVPSAGDSFSLGDATVTFVGPVKAIPNSENNNSLVLRIDFGTNSLLLMGDAEEEEESSLISAGANLSADVIKVAHHGSSSSSMLAFLRKVCPKYAVISVGDNDYGHPTAATISRLKTVGAEILRTDEVGSVIMTSDGNSISVASTKGDIYE